MYRAVARPPAYGCNLRDASQPSVSAAQPKGPDHAQRGGGDARQPGSEFSELLRGLLVLLAGLVIDAAIGLRSWAGGCGWARS
jgi:hypothetical protein